MKLNLNGNINKIYVQSLCMMFYHGVKFPENGESCDNLELTVTVNESKSAVHCTALLRQDERFVEKSALCNFMENESVDRTYKIAIGQAIYSAGAEMTGRDSGYGILTGIRPSKVVAEILSHNDVTDTMNILTKRYLMSIEKARLCIEVAKNETEILRSTDDSKCSVYISIPFCPSRCNYCSFISYAGKKLFSLIPDYLEKLCVDIKNTFDNIKKLGLTVSCIYIGGGTPTILSEEQLDRLLSTIYSSTDVNALDEYTLEGGRPDTITEKKLETAKKYGITRISINPQTLNDDVLERIGRRHTVAEFLDAYKKVSESGIPIVNTDLIAGLDYDNYDSFKATVDKIIELSPANITVHSFCVKNAAQIRSDDKDIYGKNTDFARKSIDYSICALLNNGYTPYYMYRQKNTVGNSENVGYAKKAFLGLYNVYMMSDAHTVFGIGAGATTKLVKHVNGNSCIERIFSPKYPYEYLKENRDFYDKAKNFFDRS